jgi:uncharacterized protein YdeI (YjbR/CyaY-like superfamily)
LSDSKPTFFATQDDFRHWLEKNHQTKSELMVGFYKVKSGKPSMTWPQSVDQALCFGWIDSVRYAIDHESYQIRFTPRKISSIWSLININKVKQLKEQGLMAEAGLAIYNQRVENKSKIYSFEKDEVPFSLDLEKQFKANKKAWDFFQSLAPSYRKPSSNWVMSAKSETIRQKRLHELISDSEAEKNQWKHNKYKRNI